MRTQSTGVSPAPRIFGFATDAPSARNLPSSAGTCAAAYAVLTTTGLTMIDEHIYVLQLPRMFRDVGEMDSVASSDE